jgi:hypothetical protein
LDIGRRQGAELKGARYGAVPTAGTAPSRYLSGPKEVAMTAAEPSAPAGAQSITEHELAHYERANERLIRCPPGHSVTAA